jgi:hypothetical protein
MSQKCLDSVFYAVRAPVGGGLLAQQYRFNRFPRGRGGLFQNRETKGTLPGDQLQVMGEAPQGVGQAGGGLIGNSHARPNMGMTDVTAPPAFAAAFLRGLSRSLFVSSFLKRPPRDPGIYSRAGTEEHAGRRAKSMGLPGETMRRMVPSKGLLINLIAAWKTASRQGGVGGAVLFLKEHRGRNDVL